MHADTSDVRASGPKMEDKRARRTRTGAAPLDSTWFPHILTRVVDLAPLDALLGLRATCRRLRDTIDARLFEHVVLVTVSPRSAGAKTGVGFAVPEAPASTPPSSPGASSPPAPAPALPPRLLPCIPSARQLRRPDRAGPGDSARTPSPTHVASNRRAMSHIRLLDSATPKTYDLPSFPLPLVRRCHPEAAGLPASTVVQTLSLNADDGVANAWDRFRQLAVTASGTTPLGAPGSRTGGEGGTFVAHLVYDGSLPPRRGIVLDVRRRYTLRELVLVLPHVPGDVEMGEVVEGMKVTLMMALPAMSAAEAGGGGGTRADTRVTLVGVERFGTRHFGIADAGVGGEVDDELEGVRGALLNHCRLDADDPRLTCIAYDEWARQTRPEIHMPPPDIPLTVIETRADEHGAERTSHGECASSSPTCPI